MARPRIPKAQKHTTRGVSLPPDIGPQALKRAFSLKLSFSKYVSRLIEDDLRNRRLTPVPSVEVAS